MNNSGNQRSRLPPHHYPALDWQTDPPAQIANAGGANIGFSYMFPVSKYVEAYALGPTYISYYNYMHGHQPYAWNDQWISHQTPTNPSFLSLKKVSPKGSAPDIQQAQIQMAAMLSRRTGNVVMGGQ